MKVTRYNLNRDKETGMLILAKESSHIYPAVDRVCAPADVADVMNDVFHLGIMAEEYMYMLCLNAAGRLIGVFEVSHGSMDCALTSPREIFMKALMAGAHHIILAHNHPSGDCTPSSDDRKTTDRVRESGKLLNMELQDHVIIGNGTYFSFKENGAL